MMCYAIIKHKKFLVYQLFYQCKLSIILKDQKIYDCIQQIINRRRFFILAGTKREGIMEAVRQMKILNLKKRIQYEYKMRLKGRRMIISGMKRNQRRKLLLSRICWHTICPSHRYVRSQSSMKTMWKRSGKNVIVKKAKILFCKCKSRSIHLKTDTYYQFVR